jgi:hypothetical protein
MQARERAMAEANLFTTMALLFLVLAALMIFVLSTVNTADTPHVIEEPQDTASSGTQPTPRHGYAVHRPYEARGLVNGAGSNPTG